MSKKRVAADPPGQTIASLKSPRRNARRRTERSHAMLVASLEEVGDGRSIVIDEENTVLAGNGTVKAAQDAGLTGLIVVDSDGSKVVAVRRTGLTEAEKSRLALLDNRSAELAEWDPAVLKGFSAAELAGIFSEKEVAGILSGMKTEIREDEVPEPPKNPITKTGDLWILGDHRLLCGDATKTEDVARALGGKRASVLWTDPPYGIAIGPTSVERKMDPIANDDLDEAELGNFLLAVLRIARESVSGEAFVCCDWRCLHTFRAAMDASGFPISCVIVWNKESRAQNLNRFAFVHEFIAYSGPMGAPTLDTNVWTIGREYSTEHLTPKPLELIARGLRAVSDGPVLDTFLGTGSTIIAAEQLSRRCFGLEIEPKYCDVIVQRWENLTGKKAKRGRAS